MANMNEGALVLEELRAMAQDLVRAANMLDNIADKYADDPEHRMQPDKALKAIFASVVNDSCGKIEHYIGVLGRKILASP